ncbi:hypothetical protein STEG23_001509, partial [Scotinomys teguina]
NTSRAQTPRSKINKRDLIKLKSFCKANDPVTNTKWQPTEWKKIFSNPTSDRVLIFKLYKELKKLNINKLNNPIKCGTDINRILNRGSSNVRETLEKMFDIHSHPINANKNDSEIPSYTWQNG